jgi:cytochrome c1
MLFRNKGCVTCHANARVEGKTGLLAVGPDLTTYRNEPEFLRAWLADPKALRPDTPMPNFDLSAAEIEALIAFLNEPR